ncbi:hypothetical protein KPH14_000835 [Odynerus spinipes]|uniref:Reverse transcriptase n=1 Tax=Odynerus spinipes TaxID=1348599 RepID=A0AAD9VLS2_9HYME|nr:hypothetical protein KPH14_000835 [Odynerus spinipes]
MFNTLARVAKSNWGLGHKAMSILYKGLFVPITTYAAAGWADLLKESHRRKLASVQRHALLRVTKAYRTVSTDAISVIAGVLPIDLAITERALQYKIRRSINFEFEGLAFQENEAATGSRTRSLLRARLREAILRIWQRRWLSSSKGRTTFEFFDDVQTRLRSNWVRLDTYVVQFLSGHGNFRAKLRAFNLVENELCQCGEEQTSGHLLFHCENYTNSRSDLRNKSLEIGLRDTITPRELVSKELFETFKELARKILNRQSNDDGTTQRLETDVQGQSYHLDSTGDQSPNPGTSGRDTSPTNALME